MPGSGHSPIFAPFFNVNSSQAQTPGDLKVAQRVAAGDLSVFGVSTNFGLTFNKKFEFSTAQTDFTASTLHAGASVVYSAEPTLNLTGGNAKTLFGLSVIAGVPSTIGFDIDRVRGLFVTADHLGTGNITTSLIGATMSARLKSAATVTNMIGALIFSEIITPGTGTVTDNEGVRIVSGGQGGAITNDKTISVFTPANTAVMTNHYGIFLQNQEFGTNNWAFLYDHSTNKFSIKGDGKVGIGTNAPSFQLHVVGDTRLTTRLAVGADATIGLSAGVNKLWNFADTITDFSSATDWQVFQGTITVDSGVDLLGTTVNGYRLNTAIPVTNTKNYAFVSNAHYLMAHAGSGTITTADNFISVFGLSGSGVVTDFRGIISDNKVFGTGSIGTLQGLYITGGVDNAAGSIGTYKSINITNPSTVGTITNNYGIYLEEQTGPTNNWAILYDKSANQFTVKGDGKVGIGTNAPAFNLDVTGPIIGEASATQGRIEATFTTVGAFIPSVLRSTGTINPGANSAGAFRGITSSLETSGALAFDLTASVHAAIVGTANFTLGVANTANDITSAYLQTNIGSGVIGLANGLECYSVINGGTVNQAVAVNANGQTYGGTVTSVYGGLFGILNAGATLTNAYGLFVNTATLSGGTTSTLYGLFINNQTGATTNWNLFIDGGAGASNSAISGKLTVGDNTAPLSALHVKGSQSVKRTAVGAGVYTVLLTDYYVGKTGITLGGDTVNLPTAASAGVGKIYIIKDESGTALANNITVDPSGAETIDGAATKAIVTNFGAMIIICDGANWFTLTTI